LLRVCDVIRSGGVAIYPTDTTYGLGCDLYNKRSIDRIYQVKRMDRSHPLAFLCADLSALARYAVVEDHNYRVLRHHVPGPYTFILPATREVPRIVQSKVHTVGVRIPESELCRALIAELGHPLITTTVTRPEDAAGAAINDPEDIAQMLQRTVDVMLDIGPLYGAPSSVIDLTGPTPVVLRRGSGDLSWFDG
jgi:tRNA threonylcarbamoyl adenosine modification protein (Sua5/YciO/YrdC/YwlC family)